MQKALQYLKRQILCLVYILEKVKFETFVFGFTYR